MRSVCTRMRHVAGLLGVDVGGRRSPSRPSRADDSRGTRSSTRRSLESTEALLDGSRRRSREVVGERRASPTPSASACRRRSSSAHGHGAREREHPARGRAAARGARPPPRRAGLRGQRRELRRARRGARSRRAASQLVMLTLGTGVGGGIVIGGRIFRGAHGLGGELGHVVVDADGPERARALPEPRLPRGALLRHRARARGRAAERPAVEVGGGRARGGSTRTATRPHLTIASAGTWVSASSTWSNAFEPEVVVIGGGLSAAADLFLETADRRGRLARAARALGARRRCRSRRRASTPAVIGAGLWPCRSTRARRYCAELESIRGRTY